MKRKHCGEPLIGDGYTTTIHCPSATGYEDREPDADIRHCTPDSEEIRAALGQWAGNGDSEMSRLFRTGSCKTQLGLERELQFCLAQDDDEAREVNLAKGVFDLLEWNGKIDAWVAPWYKPKYPR